MALQGNLADLPLIDLMQVLTIQRKTGILTLIQSFTQAQVAFTQARLYSAFIWQMTSRGREVHSEGVVALHEMLDWNDGQFTFELTNLFPPVENVSVPLDFIILEHCRLRDEQKRLEEETVWADLRPRLVDQPADQANVMLKMDELRVLLLVNGMLTMRDIAGMVHQETLTTISIIREMEKRGLVVIPRQVQVKVLPATYQDYRLARSITPELPIPPALPVNPALEDADTARELPDEIFTFTDEDAPSSPKSESAYPSHGYTEAPAMPDIFDKPEQQPAPPPANYPPPFNQIVAAPPPAPRPNPVLKPVQPPIQWKDKSPVEESLRPKVKRSLLGSIMAKIRGL